MTFVSVGMSKDDLETLDRCVEELARCGKTDAFLALGALSLRIKGNFVAEPPEQFSVRVPERFEGGPLRVIPGGAA